MFGLGGENRHRYALLDKNGLCGAPQKSLSATCPVSSIDEPGRILFEEDQTAAFDQANGEGRVERWLAKRAMISEGLWLIVSSSTKGATAQLRALVVAGLVSIAAVLVISVGSAWAVSRQIVHDINGIATFCGTYRLSGSMRRLAVSHTLRETSQIAAHINAMLDTIDDQIHGLEAYSERVAHELRTPLTLVRTEIERLENQVAKGQPASFKRVTELVEAISHTFMGLYRIATVRGMPPTSDSVDLTALVTELGEIAMVVASPSQINFAMQADGDFVVLGDQALFRQMIWNVIDNAIKYAPLGSAVAMRLEQQDNFIRLVVTDKGPGIPADQRESVLRPFYRIKCAHGGAGSGIGLALVSAIAKQFGVGLKFEDNEPGLRVVFSFPAAACG